MNTVIVYNVIIINIIGIMLEFLSNYTNYKPKTNTVNAMTYVRI